MNVSSTNIVVYLLKKFFRGEIKNTISLIFSSIIMNILHVAIISKLTAGIINAVQKLVVGDIYIYFKYFIIISIVYLIIYYIYKILQLRLLSKLRQWIKAEIIEIILRINNDKELQQINMTELNTPINRISSASFLVINNIISYSFPNITLLFVIISYFAYKNVVFGSLFFVCNLIILITIYCRYPVIQASNSLYEQSLNDNENSMLEILNNMDRIIQRGQNDNESDTFNSKIKHTIDKSIDFYTKSNHEGMIVTILLNITIFVNIGFLIHLFLQKYIDVTLFITFFTMILIYRERFTSMIQNIPDIAEFIGRADNIMYFFKHIVADYSHTNMLRTNLIGNMDNSKLMFDTITFENVVFSYHKNDEPILDKFNMNIQLTGLIGIVGPSGKGKSTIGKLIIKLYKYSGMIRIDGVDIQTLDNNFIRNNIIYIDQSSKLFDRKIIDNLLYGCRVDCTPPPTYCQKQFATIRDNFPKIDAILTKLDINNKKAGLSGNNLSGGQRQVLNIINGLIQDAKIVIIDEPTNALDPILKKEIIQLIHTYKTYKKAIIVITHDKELMDVLDRKLML
jgi:ABC-type bacteriocin/lantibiotic exporter with double-glycine peptidase domain